MKFIKKPSKGFKNCSQILFLFFRIVNFLEKKTFSNQNHFELRQSCNMNSMADKLQSLFKFSWAKPILPLKVCNKIQNPKSPISSHAKEEMHFCSYFIEYWFNRQSKVSRLETMFSTSIDSTEVELKSFYEFQIYKPEELTWN